MIPEKGESSKRLIVMTKDLGKGIRRTAASREGIIFSSEFQVEALRERGLVDCSVAIICFGLSEARERSTRYSVIGLRNQGIGSGVSGDSCELGHWE